MRLDISPECGRVSSSLRADRPAGDFSDVYDAVAVRALPLAEVEVQGLAATVQRDVVDSEGDVRPAPGFFLRTGSRRPPTLFGLASAVFAALGEGPGRSH